MSTTLKPDDRRPFPRQKLYISTPVILSMCFKVWCYYHDCRCSVLGTQENPTGEYFQQCFAAQAGEDCGHTNYWERPENGGVYPQHIAEAGRCPIHLQN